MPRTTPRSRNLKGALVSHKSLVARKQAEERNKAHKLAKQASIKSTSAERKAAKRATLAKLESSISSAQGGQSSSAPSPKNNHHHHQSVSIEEASSNGRNNAKGKAKEDGYIPANQKPIIPFTKDDTILLIGEANFSFSLSLIQPPHNHPAHQILATSFDSREICLEKYPDAEKILERLKRAGVKVGFGVDATDLKRSWRIVGKGRRWSRVIFNFPHVGAGINDQTRNILTNQALLLRFLRSVNPLLTEGPSDFPIIHTKKGKKVVQLRGKANNKRKKRGSDDEGDDQDDEDVIDGLGSGDEEEEEEMTGGDENGNDEQDKLDQRVNGDDDEKKSKPKTTVEKELDPPNKEGTILITLLNQPPYTLWDLPKLATRPPSNDSSFSKLLLTGVSAGAQKSKSKSRPAPIPSASAAAPSSLTASSNNKSQNNNTNNQIRSQAEVEPPRYRLLRSFQFHPSVYEGYEHRRTIGFKDGVSKSGNEEILGRQGVPRTWEFARAPPRDEGEGDD